MLDPYYEFPLYYPMNPFLEFTEETATTSMVLRCGVNFTFMWNRDIYVNFVQEAHRHMLELVEPVIKKYNDKDDTVLYMEIMKGLEHWGVGDISFDTFFGRYVKKVDKAGDSDKDYKELANNLLIHSKGWIILEGMTGDV